MLADVRAIKRQADRALSIMGCMAMNSSEPLAQHCARAGCQTAEQRDELAPSHSITWSARASNCTGTVRPSAFAVFRSLTGHAVLFIQAVAVGAGD